MFTSVGKPAYYEQKPSENKDIVQAYGLTIQYFANNEKIIIIDQAKVIQQGNTFRGEKSSDDTKKQIVTAGRGKQGTIQYAFATNQYGHPTQEQNRASRTMSSTLIAKNLAKSYKGRKVVHDVSIAIESGQIVGLLGPNGAGKTTCFYMIVGLVKADKGTVFIDQTDVSFQPYAWPRSRWHRLLATRSFDFPQA